MVTESILRTVLETVDHAIIIADAKGNFTLWNKSAQDILGINPSIQEHDSWQEHFDIYKSDGVKYKPDELPIIRGVKGESVLKERLYIKSKNMPGKHLEVDAFPIRDESSNIIGAAASFTDISNYIRMEEMVDELTNTFNHMKDLIESSFLTKKLV